MAVRSQSRSPNVAHRPHVPKSIGIEFQRPLTFKAEPGGHLFGLQVMIVNELLGRAQRGSSVQVRYPRQLGPGRCILASVTRRAELSLPFYESCR